MTDGKKLLFSVTAADCEWSYTRGSGAGGQKRNKTSSAVHCKHRASGAHGYAEDTRSQLENKQTAFVRMSKTEEFKKWHQKECARLTGLLDEVEKTVEQEMRKVRVEIRVDGIWTEVDANAPLPDEE